MKSAIYYMSLKDLISLLYFLRYNDYILDGKHDSLYRMDDRFSLNKDDRIFEMKDEEQILSHLSNLKRVNLIYSDWLCIVSEYMHIKNGISISFHIRDKDYKTPRSIEQYLALSRNEPFKRWIVDNLNIFKS